MNRIKFLFVFFISTFIGKIHARPLTKSDLHTTGFIQKKVVVSKNLNYESSSLICQTMLDDSDEAMSIGTQKYQVDLGISTLKHLKAWTQIDDKKIQIEESEFHKGYAATSLTGFSDIEQYSFSFPSVQKGARLCYEVKESHRPSLKNYFEIGAYSPFLMMEKGSSVLVESETELTDLVKDLKKNWKYKKWSSEGKFYYSLTVEEDYFDGMIFEYFSDYTPTESPLFILKSHQGYNSSPFEQLKKDVSIRANASAIPKDQFEELSKLVRPKMPLREKIELVMGWINDRIRYMGDWRTSDGRFIPRSIEKIFQTGYGDCKDFSLLTIVLLRKLGIKADYALIRRGYPESFSGLTLDESFFYSVNHAIVWVQEEGGFAVDPTNIASIAHALPDIMDRQILILSQKSEQRKTPDFNQSPTGIEKSCLIRGKGSDIQYRCQEKFNGVEGANLLAGYFRNSQDVNERGILESVSDKYSDYKFHAIPKFWDRQVKPYYLDFEWTQSNGWIDTPAGQVVSLAEPFKQIFDLKIEPRVTGVRLPLIDQTSSYVFRNFKVSHDTKNLSCDVRSPWFDIKRTVQTDGNDLKVKLIVKTKKHRLTSQELNSNEFSRALSDWDKCFRGKGLIINPI